MKILLKTKIFEKEIHSVMPFIGETCHLSWCSFCGWKKMGDVFFIKSNNGLRSEAVHGSKFRTNQPSFCPKFQHWHLPTSNLDMPTVANRDASQNPKTGWQTM